MYGLPKKYCDDCQSTGEFHHLLINSPYHTIDEFCKSECVCSSSYIKLFGKRDCNKLKKLNS